MNKQWYASKTLWINTIALVAIILQGFTGFIINPQDQAAILVVINLILRVVTGDEIAFGSKTFKK
jgi:TRAP-type C4-dicarboxylate transport system permease large subunit